MATGNRRKTSSRKTGKTKKERMAEMEKAEAFRVEIILWIIVAIALLLFISNLGLGGAVGKAVSSFLFGVFGLIAYILPILLLIGSFFAVSNKGNMLASVKLIAGFPLPIHVPGGRLWRIDQTAGSLYIQCRT